MKSQHLTDRLQTITTQNTSVISSRGVTGYSDPDILRQRVPPTPRVQCHFNPRTRPLDRSAHVTQLHRCDTLRTARYLVCASKVLIRVRNAWSWQRSAPKFRPVLTVTTASLSAARPAHQVTWRPTNCITKHSTFCSCNQCSPPKSMSITTVCAALFCADERSIAAKLTVSGREVSCGEAYEQHGWIWHQHYRKAEHVFRQWKTRTQDTFYRKSWSYERVYWSQGVQQPQHSDTLYCTLGKLHATANFGLTRTWTTKCCRLKLLFFVRLLVDPDTRIQRFVKFRWTKPGHKTVSQTDCRETSLQHFSRI
jgi:hypothetical protein